MPERRHADAGAALGAARATTSAGASRSSGTACARSSTARAAACASRAATCATSPRSTRSCARSAASSARSRPCSTARSSRSTSEGRPDFERLQPRMHVDLGGGGAARMADTPVVYMIFDLLYLDGHSTMPLPYTERRELLERARAGRGRTGRRRPTTSGDGKAMLEASASQGLEGVVAKRLDSPYEPGRAQRRLAEDQEPPAPGVRDRRLAAGQGRAQRRRSARWRWATTTRGQARATRATSARASPSRRWPTCSACWSRCATRREPLRRPPAAEGDGLRASRELVAEVEFGEWTTYRDRRPAFIQGPAGRQRSQGCQTGGASAGRAMH